MPSNSLNVPDVDIEGNLTRYMACRSEPTARYTSFDYCFNYFQEFFERDDAGGLATPDQMQVSCLQLGFYLASWGMFRGKAALLSHSAKCLEPAIRLIAGVDRRMWHLDIPGYSEESIRALLDVAAELREVLPGGRSDVLVTKTLLGVFGCVPALDRNFLNGFDGGSLRVSTLQRIKHFHDTNATVLTSQHIHTLDFTTGHPTAREYPKAKLIDMIFFIAGGG